MAAEPAFRLFSSDNDSGPAAGFGFGFSESPKTPLRPLPPCVEVLSSEVSATVKYAVEPVNFGELTLLKGWVSSQEVFELSNFDLVPGKYEGGLKIWEGSVDLVKALQSEIQNGHLSFAGKRVLEGAGCVHVQDFNAEVLKCLTIPNFNSNLNRSVDAQIEKKDRDIRFFSGDWSEMHRILPYVRDDKNDLVDKSKTTGYDVILMAETVYSISTLQSLYELVKKCMGHPHGVVYMAAKKHYFGAGGGSRLFISIVEKDGVMAGNLVAEVADGSSNVREVWKLSLK